MVGGQNRKLHRSSLAFILARPPLFPFSAVGFAGTESPFVLGVRDGASAQPRASVRKKGCCCHMDLSSVVGVPVVYPCLIYPVHIIIATNFPPRVVATAPVR